VIEKWVDVASAPGGTGGSAATSGAARAYHSLLEAVAAYWGGGLTDLLRIHLGGSGEDTVFDPNSAPDYFQVFNFTTTPANRLELIGNYRGWGWDTGAYRLHATNAHGLGGSKAAHVTLRNVQVMVTITDSSSHWCVRPASGFWDMSGGAGDWLIDSCIFRTDPTNANGFVLGASMLNPGGTGGTVRFVNTTLWGKTSRSGNGFETDDSAWADSNVFIYNCDSIEQFINYANKQIVKNSLGKGGWSGTNFSGISASSDYNSSSIGEFLPGSHNWTSQVFSFVDEANGDFHLQPTDTGAQYKGLVNPASGLYLDDAAGQIRPAMWAIGALERTPPSVIRRRTLGPKMGTRAS